MVADYPFSMTVEKNFFRGRLKSMPSINDILNLYNHVEENPTSDIASKVDVTVGDAQQSLEMYLFGDTEHASVNAPVTVICHL